MKTTTAKKRTTTRTANAPKYKIGDTFHFKGSGIDLKIIAFDRPGKCYWFNNGTRNPYKAFEKLVSDNTDIISKVQTKR